MRESLPKKVVAFLVAELSESGIGLKAESRPAKMTKDKYESLLADGAILVHYVGSKYGKSEFGASVHEREMFFDCVVLRKSMYEDSGEDEALDLLDQVIEVLAGKKHSDCSTAIYPSEDSFLASDGEEGVLQYRARVACKGMVIQPVRDFEEGAPLQSVTIDNS